MNALRHHDAELTKVSPDGIGRLGLLPDQKIPDPVLHQNRLLPGRLHGPKRMEGCKTAVQIACASALSVLPRLTKGFT